MTKPNYKAMSRDELHAYIRTHHEDDEAIGEHTVRRRPKNVIEIEMTRPHEEVMHRLEEGLQPGAKPEPPEEEES